MSIYQLSDALIFPDPEHSEPDGLLAYGGDLSVERLILAYSQGIFPWFTENDPYLWWSPNPRMVLFPKDFKRPKSLKTVINSGKFQVTFDTDFENVIKQCALVPREGQEGLTWITDEMIQAYLGLHRVGFAHSVETRLDGELVGGLYGVSLGGTFFGESMFHRVSNASKVALWHLVDRLLAWDFDLIDAQQDTKHLRNMGGKAINRKVFLHLLNNSLKKASHIGNWIVQSDINEGQMISKK